MSLVTNRWVMKQIFDVHGSHTSVTQFVACYKKAKALIDSFKGNECILMMNITRTCLRFTAGFDQITGSENNPVKLFNALTVVEVRLDSGTFNPLMIGDYAKSKGIELVGYPMYVQHHEASEARKAKRRAELRKERNK